MEKFLVVFNQTINWSFDDISNFQAIFIQCFFNLRFKKMGNRTDKMDGDFLSMTELHDLVVYKPL